MAKEAQELIGRLRRENLIQEELTPFTIPLTSFRTSADLKTVLPENPDGTTHGLKGYTHGTQSPFLKGVVAGGASATEKSRVQVALPANYVSGEAVKIRLHGHIDALLEVANSIDVQCYESDGEAGVSADLCATAATALTVAYADIDFVITATGLVAGDILDIELTSVLNDTGGAQAGEMRIGKAQLLCATKG